MNFIEIMEKAMGKKTIKEMLPLQLGEVEKTYANVERLVKDTGYKPNTSITREFKIL